MFSVGNMQLKLKEEKFIQLFISEIVKLQIIINNQFRHKIVASKIQNKIAQWSHNQFPPVIMTNHLSGFYLEFIFSIENEEKGRCKSFINWFQNKRDCCDVIDKKYKIKGKFFFQVIWRPQTGQDRNNQPPRFYQQQQQLINQRSLNHPNNTKNEQVLKSERKKEENIKYQISKPKQKVKSKPLISYFSCFGGTFKQENDYSKLIPFKNKVIPYTQNELKSLTNHDNMIISKPASYQSNKFYKCK